MLFDVQKKLRNWRLELKYTAHIIQCVQRYYAEFVLLFVWEFTTVQQSLTFWISSRGEKKTHSIIIIMCWAIFSIELWNEIAVEKKWQMIFFRQHSF